MGIADTEKAILEELQQISQEEPQDTQPAEELLEQVKTELPPVEEEAPEEEDVADYEEEAEEDEDYEEEEEDDELEVAPGAKFRHKLKAEKEARERIEKEAQELKERLARLEGRAESMSAPAAGPEEAMEEIPDQEYEPEKYAIWKAEKLEKKLQQMEASQSRINAERQWETMQADYAKKNPDYDKAKSFLLDSERETIKTQYPYATEAQITQHLKEQEYALVGNAAQSGIDPFQQIEFLAFRAGYRPGEEAPKAEEAPKKKPNIKNIKKNAKKNASLIGGSSAGETGDARTAQQLLDMSMDEMHKFGTDKYAAAIRKLEARG
jgi:hypothetical protein